MALRDGRGAGLRRADRGRPLALRRAAGGTLLVGLYGLAAAAATWPAVGSFHSAFIADGAPGHGEAAAGDHLQTVYRFWLLGHRLAAADAPWRDPYTFQPLVDPQAVLGWWPFGIAFAPLDAAFGAVVAWNVLLLATTVAAGLLTYGWLRALRLAAAPAAIGGLAFAIAPYRLEHSGGHLVGWIAILLPLALLGLERGRSAATPRAAQAWGAVAAAALVSIPLSGQVHLALGAVPLVAAYALLRFRPETAAWALAGVLGSIAAGLAIRYTIIAGSTEAGGRSLEEVRHFEAGWLDFLSRSKRGGSEQFVYLGWLTPALAVLGLAVLARRRRGLAVLLGVATLVPALLALGTNLPTYSLLWDAFPPFRFPRVPARLLPIANLALAALAAVGVARLLAVRRSAILVASLAVLVGADLAVRPLRASAADPANEAYLALAPDSGRLLELPVFDPGVHFGSVYHYYALQRPRERPLGYSTLAPPEAYEFSVAHGRLSCGAWLPGDEERLAGLGVGSVAFHRGLYAQAELPGAWFAWRQLQARGWRPVAGDGAVTLLAPGDGPPAPAPVPAPDRDRLVTCDGWRGWTMTETQAPLWVYGAGTLALELGSLVPTAARVWIDGERRDLVVDGTATVTAELPDERWHVVMPELDALFPTSPVATGLTLERLELG